MRSAQLHRFAEEVKQRALEQQLPSAIDSAPSARTPSAAAAAESAPAVLTAALVSSLEHSSDATQGVPSAGKDVAAASNAVPARVSRPAVEASFLDLNADLGMEVSEEETSEDYSEDSD